MPVVKMLVDTYNPIVCHTQLDVFCLEYCGLKVTCPMISPRRHHSAGPGTTGIIYSLEPSQASSS